MICNIKFWAVLLSVHECQHLSDCLEIIIYGSIDTKPNGVLTVFWVLNITKFQNENKIQKYMTSSEYCMFSDFCLNCTWSTITYGSTYIQERQKRVYPYSRLKICSCLWTKCRVNISVFKPSFLISKFLLASHIINNSSYEFLHLENICIVIEKVLLFCMGRLVHASISRHFQDILLFVGYQILNTRLYFGYRLMNLTLQSHQRYIFLIFGQNILYNFALVFCWHELGISHNFRVIPLSHYATSMRTHAIAIIQS